MNGVRTSKKSWLTSLLGLHPLQISIKEAEETVVQACVSSESQLVGKTWKEARVHEEKGIWVLVTKRKNKCLRPRGESRIESGDILIASGYADGADSLKQLASPTQTCSA